MRTLLTLLLVGATASTAFAQSSNWVGKTIITKRPGIQIAHTDEGGNQVNQYLDGIDYRVLAEDNGAIKVKTRQGNVAWFEKKDAVLVEDAVSYFTEQIAENPTDAALFNYRAWAWRLQGKLDMAIEDFGAAINLGPQSYLHNNRGIVYHTKKDYDKAIADYDEAIRLDPNSVYGHYNRGNSWVAKKEYDKAVADFTEAIRIDPKYMIAFTARSKAWFGKKEYEKALADYNEALRIDPNNEAVLNSLAWILATSPDAKVRNSKRAVELATKAVEADKNNPHYLDTLAAAHAEAGNFKEAIRLQERAMQDALVRDNADYRERLELYRQSKPFREK